MEYANPLAVLQQNTNRGEKKGINYIVSGTYEIIKGLKANGIIQKIQPENKRVYTTDKQFYVSKPDMAEVLAWKTASLF